MGKKLRLSLILLGCLCLGISTQLRAADYYWIGGSGNWSDINNWATTSGGATIHVVVPALGDNVIFDANSFSAPGQVVNVDVGNASCHDMVWTGAGFNPTITGANLRIAGSLTLIPNMTFDITVGLNFESTATGEQITTANHPLPQLLFDGVGGEWTLQDNFNMGSNTIVLRNGSLICSGKNLMLNAFLANGTGTKAFDIAGGSVLLTGNGTVWDLNATNTTLSFNNAPITCSGTNAAFNHIGPIANYHDLTFADGASSGTINGTGANFQTVSFGAGGFMNGNNQMVNLNFVPGETYTIQNNSTQVITGNWQTDGACLNETRIVSSSGQATIQKASGQTFNYVELGGINAVGAGFTAISSVDLGNNTNITFVPATSRTLYWVDDSGDWNDISHWSLSSGGPGGACVPTPIDDVVFDANSFSVGGQTVVVDQTANCRNMNWTLASNTPSFTGGANLNIYASLSLSASMNWNVGNTYFQATLPGNTILTNGTQVNGNIRFVGNGGEWTLLDDLDNGIFTWYHERGSILTGGNDVYTGAYFSNYNQIRSLTLGASNIFILPNQGNAWFMNGQNFTLDAGTSHIHIYCYGNAGYNFRTSNATTLNFHDLSFEGNYSTAFILGTTNFRDVRFETHGFIANSIFTRDVYFEKGFTYFIGGGQTLNINRNLITNATCQESIEIVAPPNQTGIIAKPSGNITISWVTMESIHAQGPGTFQVNNGLDLGNNLGWTFSNRPSFTLYWVGGDGQWNEASNWSFTSGGPGNGCVPTAADDVVFDANSFTAVGQTVMVDTLIAYCRNMDWTGAGFSPSFVTNRELRIYGSVTFIEDMSTTFNRFTYFVSFNPGNTITMAGQVFEQEVQFDRIGGEWTFLDEFECARELEFRAGVLNTNGQLVRLERMRSETTYPRELILGASEITLVSGNNPWIINRGGFSLDGGTSHLVFLASNANIRHTNNPTQFLNYYDATFVSTAGSSQMRGGKTRFNHLKFNAGGSILNDSNLFDTLSFSAGYEYQLHAGLTQVVYDLWDAKGNCSDQVRIISNSGGTQAVVSMPNNYAQLVYARIQDIQAIGSQAFVAANSVDMGNNSGWNFSGQAGTNFYWIGGTGNWDDPMHWSGSSGGPPLGNCIPGPLDDVYFDVNSFSAPNQWVALNIPNPACHSMFWTGAQFVPSFIGTGASTMNIHGSMYLNADMNLSYTGNTLFLSEDGPEEFIESFGQEFQGDVYFSAPGTWNLLDDFRTTGSVFLEEGRWNTHGHEVHAWNYGFFDGGKMKTLDMGKTNMFAYAPGTSWYADANNFNFMADTSTIHISGEDAALEVAGVLNFHNVWFLDSVGYNELNTLNNDFNYVYFFGDGEMFGSNRFDTLRFSPAHTYLLEAGETQYVDEMLHARGNNCFLIVIQSNDIPNPAYIEKTTGVVDSDFLELKSVNAIGGADFYAGVFSTDGGNNVGWDFTNSGNYQYGLGPDTTAFLCSDLDTFRILTLNFNGGVAWLWQDGYTGPEYPAYESGEYKVTVWFAENCATSDSIVLDIKKYIPIAPEEPILCEGDDVDLVANGNRFGFDYVWNTGETSGQINVQPSATTEYQVEVSLGDYTCYDSIEVKVTDPKLSFEVTGVSCFGGSDGSIKPTMEDGYGTINFTWLHGPTTGEISNLSPGWYYLTAIDSIGCSVYDSVFVPEPTPVEINLDVPEIACFGDKVAITPTGLGGTPPYTYDWGSLDSSAIGAGTHVIGIIDANGCRKDTVLVLNQPPLLSAIVNPSPVKCYEDMDGQAVALPQGGVGPYTYSWSSGSTDSIATGLGAGIHSLTITDSMGCDTTISFELNALTDVVAQFDADNLSGKRPLNVQLENLSQGAHVYYWYFEDSGDSTSGFAPDYTFNTVGRYEVMLVAYDTINGCTDTSYLEFKIESNPSLSTPNVFTPNGDGRNDVFYISGDDISSLDVKIYGRWGELVYQFEGLQNGWDGNNQNGKPLPEGTYYYTLEAIDLDGASYNSSGHVMLSR